MESAPVIRLLSDKFAFSDKSTDRTLICTYPDLPCIPYTLPGGSCRMDGIRQPMRFFRPRRKHGAPHIYRGISGWWSLPMGSPSGHISSFFHFRRIFLAFQTHKYCHLHQVTYMFSYTLTPIFTIPLLLMPWLINHTLPL